MVDTRYGGNLSTVGLLAPWFRSVGVPARWPAGGVVYREAEPATSVLLIGVGRAKVTLSSPTGRRVLLALRGPGDLLGESAVLDGRLRSVDVSALSDVRGWLVPAESLLARLTTRPEAGLELSRMLVGRLREGDLFRLERSARDTAARLAGLLLAVSERHAQAGWLHLTQAELGEAVGASREATVKALARLRSARLVETARGRVRVRNAAAKLAGQRARQGWTTDDERLVEAGVPDDIEFLTKPALATGMICRALNAGAPARWVAGDEVYGADPTLRAELELRRVGYVLGIGCDRRVPTARGPLRADTLTASLPKRAWQRLSAGPGAKGERYYDWALITLLPPAKSSSDGPDTQCWWLLVRRHRSTGELAFYRCYSPEPVPLRELVRVAGRRWTVEESFQAGKGLAGLDEHQVRRWTSWRRWTLFAMLAHALLAVIAANEHAARPAPAGLIALTCNEIRRLLTVLIVEPGRVLACPEAWSTWRRRHQHRSRTSHYQRQEASLEWP